MKTKQAHYWSKRAFSYRTLQIPGLVEQTITSAYYLQITAAKKDWEVLIGKSSLESFPPPVICVANIVVPFALHTALHCKLIPLFE